MTIVKWLTEQTTNNEQVEQIVTFHEDELVDRKVMPEYLNIGTPLKESSLSTRAHDLKDFLSRPLICHQGTWSTTDVAGDNLFSMTMPNHIFALPSINEKVRGFLGFRARMIVRVQLNAQRFQQGRLLINYIPMADLMSPERLYTISQSLIFQTQLPRVELDAGDTDAILEVPFVGPQLYYGINDGSNQFGRFQIIVYSPLTTVAAPLDCQYTVWCHFEDVEIVFPAAPTSVILNPQSGRMRKRNTTDQELAGEFGPLSKALNKVSTAASILGEIPLISSFAGVVSWSTSIMSRAASVFGLSKPTNESPPCSSQLRTFAMMNNFDGVDHSMKMALSSQNKIEELPGFAGTDIDEMSIPYLVSIPAWISSINWSSLATEGTSLFSMKNAVGTDAFQPAVSLPTMGSSLVIGVPPFVYVGSAFDRWRGGITYTFKVVKTEFHSGRLLFVFYPGATIGSPEATYSNAQYCFRQVFDLRVANEFIVTIPYVKLVPWTNIDNHTGIWQLFVLNELRAPDTVSQDVQILIECNGAPDMEFQFPNELQNLTPALYTEEEPPLGRSTEEADVLRPQSGSGRRITADGPATMNNKVSSIDQSGVHVRALEPARYCAGEAIQSIRQLMKRFCFMWTSSSDYTAGYYIPFPFAASLGSGNASGYNQYSENRIDMVNYFNPLYLLSRGSMRFKVVAYSTVESRPMNAVLLRRLGYVSNVPVRNEGVVGNQNLLNVAFTYSQLTGGTEAEVPPYQVGHCRVNNVMTPTNGLYSLNSTLYPDQSVVFRNDYAAGYTTGVPVMRAIGDDYSLGFFLGTIPLVRT